MNEIKGEIPSITNVATTAAVTAAENKIAHVRNLSSKGDIANFVKKYRF